MTRDKVTLDSREIAVNEIVRITFKGEPPGLAAARNNVIQRNYNQALTELARLDGQQVSREFVRQDIEYYKALCQCKLAMSEGGDKTAAMNAMLNFVRAAPQSYHFYEAAETLGDLAMASGKWADVAVLEPVRDYKARHASTMLTFDAVVSALDQIEAKLSSKRPQAAE